MMQMYGTCVLMCIMYVDDDSILLMAGYCCSLVARGVLNFPP